MNSYNTDVKIIGQQRVDLERGLPRTEKSSSPTPTPATTSSTAFSQTQSTVSGKSKWRHTIKTLLSHVSLFHTRSDMPHEDPQDGQSQTSNEQLPTGDPTNIMRTLDSCPEGYPQLAAFLDSDENFMLYRRFGYLQARILLHKQDELRALETKLEGLDKKDNELADTKKYLKSRDIDDKRKDSQRKALLHVIETTFKEYAELLTVAQTMAGLNKPADRDYISVKNYFLDEAPLDAEDEYYIYRKEDIISLKPGRENAWLDGILERVLQKLNCPPVRYLFRSAETRAKWRTGNVVYYTKSRIDILVTFIIAAMILLLMVVPVYILWHLSILSPNPPGPDTRTTIGVLLLFTLVFSGVLSFFTRAKRHEIFGAAAAYCAVLVVFISNVQVAGQAVANMPSRSGSAFSL